MKCIIADDEYWVRVSLASMLMEISPGLQIVGEVSNGAALLDVLPQLRPDVVFVDIRMPKMTGLEVMRAAKDRFGDICWVILSGSSEFEFAREALSLGAMDYLLKPVSQEKLAEVLGKAEENLARSRRNRLKLFRHDLYSLLYEDYLIPEEDSDLKDHWLAPYIITADSSLDWREQNDRIAAGHQSMAELRSALEDGLNVAGCLLPSGNDAIVLMGPSSEAVAAGRAAFDARLDAMLSGSRGAGYCETVCTAGMVASAATLRDVVGGMEALMDLRTICGIGRRIDFSELEDAAKAVGEDGLRVCGMLVRSGGIQAQDGGRPLPFAPERLLSQCQSLASRLDPSRRSRLCEYLLIAFGLDVPEDARARWPELLCAHIQRQMERPKGGQSLDLVEQARAYVDGHYSEDIGVAQIAEVLQITPNYLSTIFRKREGVTLIRYLTQVRLAHARELLLHTDLLISQIAARVGYTDSHYFTRVFREAYNVYPTDYRQKREE